MVRRRKRISQPVRRAKSLASVLPAKFLSWFGIISIMFFGLYFGLKTLGYDPLSLLFMEISYKKYDSFGIKIPTRYTVHGIDVSRYQEGINWKLVKEMDEDGISIKFAFIKATEGIILKDVQFDYNWKEAKKHGIIRGAYHYFKPATDPERQAKHFLKVVDIESGDLPPVLDVEEVGRLTRDELVKKVQTWLDYVKNETGIKPIVYTNKIFYETNLRDWLDEEYPLWIAHYDVASLKLESKERWLFWQHSDKGRVNGIDPQVDFNVFYGKEQELRGLCVE